MKIKLKLKCEKLKAFREKNKLSQLDLANKINTSKNTIQGWESGERNPSILSYLALCEALKIDPRDYVENPEDLPAVSSSPKQEFEELLKNINAPDGLVNLLKFHASLSPEARKKINKSLNEKLDKTLTDIIKEL